MSSLDEIHDLENRINDRVKTVNDAGLEIVKIDQNLKKTESEIEGLNAKVTLHTGNLKHIKNVADFVDFKEHAENRYRLEDVKEKLEDARNSVLKLETKKKRLQDLIDSSNRLITELKQTLGKYGQVLQFSSKQVT